MNFSDLAQLEKLKQLPGKTARMGLRLEVGTEVGSARTFWLAKPRKGRLPTARRNFPFCPTGCKPYFALKSGGNQTFEMENLKY